MPKTEPTVGNDDCAKWTTGAITDKAQGSVEAPACAEPPASDEPPATVDFAASTNIKEFGIAEPPASVDSPAAVGSSVGGGGTVG